MTAKMMTIIINRTIKMNIKVNLMTINKATKMYLIQEVIFKVQIHQIVGFKVRSIQILMSYKVHKIMQKKVLNHLKIIVYKINLKK